MGFVRPEPSETTSRGPDVEVALVCHAGTDLGIGHLTRMLAVAAAMRADGRLEPHLLIQGERLVRADLDSFDHRFVDLDVDLVGELPEPDGDRPSAVVLDVHPRHIPDQLEAWVESARASGVIVVGVDALLPWCDRLDATWVPSVLVPADSLERCEDRVHWGWNSFLIQRADEPAPWSPGGRVVVLTGGSDVTHQSRRLPASLDTDLPEGTEVVWVRGPFAEAPAIPEKPRLEWEVVEAPAGITDVIRGAGYALAVFGVTVFDLLQSGIPTVAFNPYADRAFPELAVLQDVDAAEIASGPDDAVKRLRGLIGDDVRAEALATTSRSLMADNGAERLVRLIHSLAE